MTAVISPTHPSWNRSASGRWLRSATCRATMRDQPEVGSDEPLPGPLPILFEQQQLGLGGFDRPGSLEPGGPGQHAGLDLSLQADHLSGGQQGLLVLVIGHGRHCAAAGASQRQGSAGNLWTTAARPGPPAVALRCP